MNNDEHPLGWSFAPEVNIEDMIPKQGFCEECKQTKKLGMVALKRMWDNDTNDAEFTGPLEFTDRGYCIECIKLKAGGTSHDERRHPAEYPAEPAAVPC